MSLIADTGLGRLQGAQHRGVVQFRGVPYARPPLGGLHFRPPSPQDPWPGSSTRRHTGRSRHHLFADLLRARLQAEQPGRVQELHRAAAAWCGEHDLADDAVRHAVAAGDGPGRPG